LAINVYAPLTSRPLSDLKTYNHVMEISFVYLELHRLAYYTFESPGLSKLFEKPGFQCGEFEPEGLKVYYI